MDPEAPKRGRRRGLHLLWLALPLFPVAALAILNLWLASPLGRGWIAGKIHQRTGLETLVAGASASPWNGIQVSGLKLLQPPPLRSAVDQPLFEAQGLKLTPVWRAWLKGRTEIQAVDLVSPHATLPVEWIADLVRGQTAPPPQAPAVTANPPPATSQAPAQPPTAPAAVPTPPQPPAIQLPPTGWLRMKDASFRLVSASRHKDLFEISGVSGEIPVSGNAARSNLQLGSLRIAGEETLSNVNASLVWQPPFLTLQPLETRVRGVKLAAAGQAALVRGLPVQMEIQAPAQVLPPIDLPRDSQVEAGGMTAQARFRGLLLAPSSWQGEWVTQSERIRVRVAGRETNFDRGFMVTTLRGGMLSCNDARLIGDDLSLLGNATLIADGRLAAVLRIVAAPDAATAIAGRLLPNPVLTLLSTPQRVAVDLHAAGNLQQVSLFQSNSETAR